MQRTILGVAAILLTTLIESASARPASTNSGQAWLQRPVRIVVGFPLGGGIDVAARLWGVTLSESLGQQIVVDNRSSTNDILATEIVAKAFGAFMKAESLKWAGVIKQANIRAD